MKHTLFIKLYFVISLFYLLILYLGHENLDLYLKPILIPVLGFVVYLHERFPLRNTLLTALLFSWIGDVILLFADIAEIYFILGLVSFLISHIMYCIVFSKQIKTETKTNKSLFAIGSLVIMIYLFGILSVLSPSLGDLKIPVTVYATVISIMLLLAFNGFLVWKKSGSKLVFIGAIAFVISDSILAINKFYMPIQKSALIIMLTYLVAQYLIVVGVLKLNSKTKLVTS
ncbi:lysoplasmalogenase [Flavobacterium sp. ANB]|uniref:lysoplasmalogenase n=1 Tax=unclassified Flavobacterium TaxID=196869 RepID=UPI0012B98784|nr:MULTISPECIES: lysoplasmalogenase [unclassified Flavobacterium]MBF4519303.1 lysoplasmalogenase [Flavobacterium sp. ANB]MTD72246.1 lysoplasmalogenase [Flavobacterium sp. LC2016-13]